MFDLLPARLSASSVESLRRCPYQFFGRVMLGLRETEELEAEIGKRDYGTWLHGVLKRFHDARLLGTEVNDATLLRQAAADEPSPSAEDFLPFTAGFDGFATRYLAWLAETESQGQRYVMGEADLSVEPFLGLAGLKLEGRLDRIDEDAKGTVLIDYKTGTVDSLKKRVADPLEDTQLAVYAALRATERAGYLALDNKDAIVFVEHESVDQSAAILIEGLGDDLHDLRDGVPMPALGEGMACEFCAMRGLCRKDDWT